MNLAGGPDAALGDRHCRALRLLATWASRLVLAAAQELPPDEEGRRDAEDDDRDPRVQTQPGEMVRGIDAQELLDGAPRRVVRDVEREERRRPEAEAAVEQEQQPHSDEVVDELEEEGRLERGVVLIARDPVLEVDLHAPGLVGRLAVELLVPPVPPAADPLREQQPWRDGVHEVPHAGALAADDDRADEASEQDPAPDAETALPDREDPFPLRAGDLAPVRDVVVGAGADDPGGHPPDRDLQHEIPVAAPA